MYKGQLMLIDFVSCYVAKFSCEFSCFFIESSGSPIYRNMLSAKG